MTAREKFEHVDKFATCKRCGDNFVAWRQGTKWYLVAGHLSNTYLPRVACAPREFHVCLPDASPAQIDGALAELWPLLQETRMRIAHHSMRIGEIEAGRGRRFEQPIEWHRGQLLDAKRRMTWILFLCAPFEEEFKRRGGWSRYFLVQNAGGHVHREMSCSTCYPTTRYAWLVDLADCDESKMVDEYGTTACTVCFPNAPTLPGWARSEAAQAAAASVFCPGSGSHDSTDVNGSKRLYAPWARCNACWQAISITSTGKLRKHKKVQEDAR